MSYDRNARMLALGYTYAPARERWYTIEVVANPVGKKYTVRKQPRTVKFGGRYFNDLDELISSQGQYVLRDGSYIKALTREGAVSLVGEEEIAKAERELESLCIQMLIRRIAFENKCCLDSIYYIPPRERDIHVDVDTTVLRALGL